jgi:tRNA 2-thiocytidine biosynthesis protein TtcA
VKKYSLERAFPTVKNECPTSENSRRSYIKKLLDQLEVDNPQIRHNIYTALGHVKPDYLLPKPKK